MAKLSTKSVKTSDGGIMTSTMTENGGFALTITRGYKETPEQRLERIRNSPRSARFDSKAAKGGRRGDRKRAIKDSMA